MSLLVRGSLVTPDSLDAPMSGTLHHELFIHARLIKSARSCRSQRLVCLNPWMPADLQILSTAVVRGW